MKTLITSFILGIVLFTTGCSTVKTSDPAIKGNNILNATNVVIAAASIKVAYKDARKQWAYAKKGFDIGKLDNQFDRIEVKSAAETIDGVLNRIQSVREADTVNKALVIADINRMRSSMESATSKLSAVYDRNKDKLNASEKKSYTTLLANLRKLSQPIPGLNMDDRLIAYLDLISDLSNAVKALK